MKILVHFLKEAILAVFVGAIFVIGLNVRAVSAQSEGAKTVSRKADAPRPADQAWHVDLAPYLWFPVIHKAQTDTAFVDLAMTGVVVGVVIRLK